jgi:hypothetical protein
VTACRTGELCAWALPGCIDRRQAIRIEGTVA